MDKSQEIHCPKWQLTWKWLHFQVLVVCLLVSVQSIAQTTAYNWRSVAIGGGGFVSAIIPSKTQSGLVYARTDVGGAYRWNTSTNSWIPLTDWVSEDQVGFLGVESLALDPNNPGRLYMLVGISYFNDGRTAILRSNDYGNTFTVTEVTSQLRAHGNGMGRQSGEKLVVDPNNSNVLYCGTRANGLFRSTNAGANWSRVSSLNVTTTPNENGVSFVVLDPSSNSGGNTQRIFVGVSRSGSAGANFYRSDNGGQSFTAVSGAPSNFMPHRAVLASNGNLYVTYGNGAGPHGNSSGSEPMDNGQIWRYNISSGAWTNITPSGFNRAFGGISVDPNNPNRIVASTINTYMNQNGAWGDRIFLSTNGGSSWVDVIDRGFTMDTDGITWVSGHSIHWAGSIEFDPFNTQKVWVTSGNGIFVNDNINSSGTWRFTVRGLEETVPLGLESIPNGPVISVIGDYDGFRHTNLTQYAPIHNPQIGTTTGLAVAAQNTSKIVRVGNSMYYSTNTGTSWTQCNINGTQGQVALSANGNTFLHSPRQSSVTYRSTNNGSSWSTVSGLSFNEARPVADPVNSNKFYAYNPETGAVFVSTNGGSSFSQASSVSSWGSKVIRLAPGREGHVWIALNGGGLARSTNSGQSFSTISGITHCGAVGFGVAASGANYPTIYIWGTVNNVRGVYRSTNEGASWTRINTNAQQYGGPGNGQFIQGDMNVFGRVYMSTAGRGIVFGDPASCTPTTITPYVQVNNGSWQQTSSVTVSSGATVRLGPQPASGGSWSWSGMASGTTREVTLNPTSSGTATATYTNSSGCQSTQVFTITVNGGSGGSIVTIANRATGLLIDGMGRTSAGSACGQYASSGSWNQMWILETSGAYVYIRNRNTGLYIDGRGISTNGTFAGQWSSSTSENLQWQQETTGGYVKFRNRATGLYLDGMGNSTNGADLGQWSNSTSNNQQWTVSSVASAANVSDARVINLEEVSENAMVYPNPFTTGIKVLIPDPKVVRSISMFDQTGKMVQFIGQEDVKNEQPMGNHLSVGLYIIQIDGVNGRQMIKVIKK